jgi:hypothetical protein
MMPFKETVFGVALPPRQASPATPPEEGDFPKPSAATPLAKGSFRKGMPATPAEAGEFPKASAATPLAKWNFHKGMPATPEEVGDFPKVRRRVSLSTPAKEMSFHKARNA